MVFACSYCKGLCMVTPLAHYMAAHYMAAHLLNGHCAAVHLLCSNNWSSGVKARATRWWRQLLAQGRVLSGSPSPMCPYNTSPSQRLFILAPIDFYGKCFLSLPLSKITLNREGICTILNYQARTLYGNLLPSPNSYGQRLQQNGSKIHKHTWKRAGAEFCFQEETPQILNSKCIENAGGNARY